jgi:hypothetical protein
MLVRSVILISQQKFVYGCVDRVAIYASNGGMVVERKSEHVMVVIILR